MLAAGGFPVLLPYLEDPADRREAIARADGLVLAGGRDIDPARYGRREPHPAQLAPAWKLDEIELDYAGLAVEHAVPVLGICRGCQILNVAFGGTLFGDLDEFPGGGADHPGAKWERVARAGRGHARRPARPAHPTHPIDIAPDSLLAAHLGERADVDSYHHQAIRDVGQGLVATAFAPHGTVEADRDAVGAGVRAGRAVGAARGMAGRRAQPEHLALLRGGRPRPPARPAMPRRSVP